MANTERVESRFYTRDGDAYVCGLCPHGCRLRPGQYGRCGSRRADEDMLVAYSYGKVSSIAVDPIEKKPLYHYRPRSRCFSVGSVGCNMRCRHCQNYSISMMSYGKKRTTYESPEELAAMCRHEGLDTIAFTYNEPGIWFEYIMDVMKVDPGLHLVLVTNGFLNEEPLRQLCGVADAINLDVKGFTEDFYGRICEGRLADVMRSARIIRDEGVHLELTYLVIPGHNDSEDEVRSFCGWVRDELGADVPVHFTRFHPDFEMMDVPMTPVETVMRCREIGMGCGLEYVFVGNVVTEHADNTYCPGCGAMLVSRLGYLVDIVGLDGDRCSSCGRRIPIRLRSEVPEDSPEPL